jgi:2,4-dienoyl-CoA reductase (NADPH2)
MTEYPLLFQPYTIQGLNLKNRITMAPLFLGYGEADGRVSPLLLDHYREMAASGVAMVVVENAAVHETGLGSPLVIRTDHDRYLPGLAQLAQAIQEAGALAILQINHAGRYAYTPERLAPSEFITGGITPKAMSSDDLELMVAAYASAASRVREAGFDGVEIHGGTGYLLVQFLSHRTNQRTDDFGGSLENRMRFPVQVVEAVRKAVGSGYPVGYRFLADELLPDGLKVEETVVIARELGKRGLAYLSVMAGTYDSFFLPEVSAAEKSEAYMVSYAKRIKEACPEMPIIAAGRIQLPETAEGILTRGEADLIGLARVLLADPLWPQKVAGKLPHPIVKCEPNCFLCTKRVMMGRKAFCAKWTKERRQAFLAGIGETEDADLQS